MTPHKFNALIEKVGIAVHDRPDFSAKISEMTNLLRSSDLGKGVVKASRGTLELLRSETGMECAVLSPMALGILLGVEINRIATSAAPAKPSTPAKKHGPTKGKK